MEITMTINATAKDFYNLILASCAHDINRSTNQNLTPNDITSGFTYKKNLTNKIGKTGDSTAVIKTVDFPHLYEATFTTRRGINTLSYQIHEESKGKLCINYKEVYEPIDKSHALNFKLTNFFYRRSFKKKMTNTITLMEQHLAKIDKSG